MQNIRERDKPFWINSTRNRQTQQQYLQSKAHNVGKRYYNDFNTAYYCLNLELQGRAIFGLNMTLLPQSRFYWRKPLI